MSKADEIRKKWQDGEKQIDIANDLGVSEPYVSKIVAPLKIITISTTTRLNYLLEIVKNELNHVPSEFTVKLVQLFYNDNHEQYDKYKCEDITKRVAI